MPLKSGQLHEFGAFVLDTSRHLLLREKSHSAHHLATERSKKQYYHDNEEEEPQWNEPDKCTVQCFVRRD